MLAHEKIEEIEDQLVSLREAVAFAWQFAKEHGHESDESLFEHSVKGIDDALSILGWVRVGLSEARPFDVESVPEDAGRKAYFKLFEQWARKK